MWTEINENLYKNKEWSLGRVLELNDTQITFCLPDGKSITTVAVRPGEGFQLDYNGDVINWLYDVKDRGLWVLFSPYFRDENGIPAGGQKTLQDIENERDVIMSELN